MVKQVNLTRARVDSFACPAELKEAFLWDLLQPGFGIRAFSSGKKSYVFRATVNGKTRKGVIGDASGDLNEARNKARRLKTLADRGISPAEDKQQRIEIQKASVLIKKRSSVKLKQVWDDYLKANRSSWGGRHYRDHLAAFQEPGLPCGNGLVLLTKAGPLWVLRDIKLAEIDSDILVQWMGNESKIRPGVAARASRLMFACLNWSNEINEYSGLVDVTKLKTRQLRNAVPKLKPKKDVLERGQLTAWFTEVRKVNNPVIAAFAQCLLITGARRGELVSLKWCDVDFQWDRLTIRDKATT